MATVNVSKLQELRSYSRTALWVGAESPAKGHAVLCVGASARGAATALFRPGQLRYVFAPVRLDPMVHGKVPVAFAGRKAWYAAEAKGKPSLRGALALSQLKRANVAYDLGPEVTHSLDVRKAGSDKVAAGQMMAVVAAAYTRLADLGYDVTIVFSGETGPWAPRLLQEAARLRSIATSLPEGARVLVWNHSTQAFFCFHVSDKLKESAVKLMATKVLAGEDVGTEPDPSQEGMPSDARLDREEDAAAKASTEVLAAAGVNPEARALTPAEDEALEAAHAAASKASADGEGHEDILARMDADPSLADALGGVAASHAVATPAIDPARAERLRSAQNAVRVGGKASKTVGEILADMSTAKIVTAPMPIKAISKSAAHSALREMDRSYATRQHDKDVAAVLTSFSDDKSYPVFLEGFEREETSDEMSFKETVTATFRDKDGQKHTFRVDMPLLKDHRFMFVNGSYKSIRKQLIPLPIVKTGPREVKVTTNYNRVFISLFGRKVDRHVWQLRKYVESSQLPKGVRARFGNASEANAGAAVTSEYTEMGAWMLSFSGPRYELWFDSAEAARKAAELGLSVPKGAGMVVGYDKSGKIPIVTRLTDSRVFAVRKGSSDEVVADSISQLVAGELGEGTLEAIYAVPAGTSYAYSRASVLGRKVPVAVMVGLDIGLKGMLDRAGVHWKFEEKARRLTPGEKATMEWVDFKDGRLLYASRPLRNRVLLNGLSEVDCSRWSFDEMSGKDPWVSAVEACTGTRAAAKGLDNTAAMLIDPITKDLLKSSGLPTDYAGVLLHASSMLEATDYMRMNDMGQYRVRGNEMIVAYMYAVLAESFKAYRDSSRAGNPVKISAPREAVMRQLTDSQVIADYAQLNPVLEIEELSAISPKGPSGVNVDDAYTLEARAYDESMMGILALNTPDSATVGVVRHLTYNPRVLDDRGALLSPPSDLNDMKHTEILSVGEALSPFTSAHADPPRIGMAITQAKHVVPIKHQTRPLVGNGSEKSLVHMIGSDFAFKADQDGVVAEMDDKLGLMTIKYEDGKVDVVDLSDAIANNRGGGFYIRNRKVTELKKGSRFKAGQVLAHDPSYFSKDEDGDHVFTVGRLTKVALLGGDFTIEDSSLITESFKEAMSMDIVMRKAVTLGAQSNVEKVARKGQHVKTGDTLIVYDASFEDVGANKLLAKVGEELGQAIEELGKNVIQSKHTGTVVDVRVLWNRELEEMSPSLRKLIESYVASVRRREQKARKVRTAPGARTFAPVPLAKLPPDARVNGQQFDGVVVEFYVEHAMPMGVGDKVGFDTAMKTIVSDVIPQEEYPYTARRPGEPIEAILSPLSVISRMTTDFYSKLFVNKVIVELKEEVRKIMEG
jgi:hypothetical protein